MSANSCMLTQHALQSALTRSLALIAAPALPEPPKDATPLQLAQHAASQCATQAAGSAALGAPDPRS